MTDFNLPDGVNSADLSTAAEVIREERTCGDCGSTTTVDIVRIERAFDYQDEWTCPVCHHTFTEELDDPADEPDPDLHHDAMREED